MIVRTPTAWILIATAIGCGLHFGPPAWSADGASPGELVVTDEEEFIVGDGPRASGSVLLPPEGDPAFEPLLPEGAPFDRGPEPLPLGEDFGGGCADGVCGPGACSCADDVPGVLNRICRPRKCWVGRVDALLLWRNAPRDRPLYTTFNAATEEIGPTVLDANAFESDPLAAPRISLFHVDHHGYAMEATYLYAGNFYANRTLDYRRDGYALAEPGIYGNPWGNQPGAPPISSASGVLLANLQSAELNARVPLLHKFFADRAQFLFGVRWVEWNETFRLTDFFFDVEDPFIRGNDFYDTGCYNNLFGGQIGLDAILYQTSWGVRFDSLVKAGAYYNAASQSSDYRYVTTAPFDYQKGVSVGPESNTAAFVGELGLTAVIPIHCNLDLRIGYFGLWLEGIAQPTSQLSGQNLAQPEFEPAEGSLTATGGIVVQGFSLGLEGRW
jgi:hypothetical protein